MRIPKGTLRQICGAYIASIGIWLPLSLLTGCSYLLFAKRLSIHTSFGDMLCSAEARGLSLALLTPPVFYLVRQCNCGIRHRLQYLLAFTLGAGPFMVLYACIHWLLLPPWDSALQKYVPRSLHPPFDLIYAGFADQITMYIAIVVAAHAYEYSGRVRKQELETDEYQRALADKEMQGLKMQLHPHFLFNSLHGIATLIDSDQRSAKAMVIKLSGLLRMALQHHGSDLIALQKELRFVKEYLDLEGMRFGTRLSVGWSIAPNTGQVLVPQSILQPVVENGIRHGIACSRGRGFVEIYSRRNSQNLELQVCNSIGSGVPRGNGIGRRNTEARSRHLYSDEATLSFSIGEDRTADTTLCFPALGSAQFPADKVSATECAGESTTAGFQAAS
jgi:two-component system LytT family sensor kinase